MADPERSLVEKRVQMRINRPQVVKGESFLSPDASGAFLAKRLDLVV